MRNWWLFILSAAPLYPCSCVGWPSAPQAWQGSTLVFAGRVERASMGIRGEGDSAFGEQTAWIKVEEPFKGVRREQSLTLKQQISSCGGEFTVDDRLLFYLFPAEEPDTWEVHACHRSRGLEAAADDFLFLRALPDSAKTNRLSGTVELYEQSWTDEFESIGRKPASVSRFLEEVGL
jgi:hypothetical protein